MSEQISAWHRFTNWHETELEAHIGSLCVILLKRHAWSQTSTSAPPRLHLGWENKSFSNRDEYQERTGWNQISSPASLSDYGTKSVEHRLFYLPSDHPYLILFLTVSFLQCSHFRKLSALHFQLWYRCVEFWPNAMLTILPLKWKMLHNVHFWPCCVWRGCRAFFKSKIVIWRTHVHV